jgi:NADH-quinone oxidoreductase subunit M
VPVASLLTLSLAIGVFPRPLLDLVEPASRLVTGLVSR